MLTELGKKYAPDLIIEHAMVTDIFRGKLFLEKVSPEPPSKNFLRGSPVFITVSTKANQESPQRKVFAVGFGEELFLKSSSPLFSLCRSP